MVNTNLDQDHYWPLGPHNVRFRQARKHRSRGCGAPQRHRDHRHRAMRAGCAARSCGPPRAASARSPPMRRKWSGPRVLTDVEPRATALGGNLYIRRQHPRLGQAAAAQCPTAQAHRLASSASSAGRRSGPAPTASRARRRGRSGRRRSAGQHRGLKRGHFIGPIAVGGEVRRLARTAAWTACSPGEVLSGA